MTEQSTEELIQWCWKLQKRIEDLEHSVAYLAGQRKPECTCWMGTENMSPKRINDREHCAVHGTVKGEHDNTLWHGECECLPIEGFHIGDRVRVKDDARMWGDPQAAPSGARGQTGRIIAPLYDLQGYDCFVEFDDDEFGGRWYYRELEHCSAIDELAFPHGEARGTMGRRKTEIEKVPDE